MLLRIVISAGLLVLLSMQAKAEPSLQQVQSIPLKGVEGRIDHMAVDLAANRLYVAALGNDTVEVIDTQAGKRVGTLRGMKEPQGVAVVGETGKVVVASGQDGTVRVYDRALKLLGTLNDLDDADNVRYDASAKLVYVGYGEGALAVVEAEKVKKVADITLSGHPESFRLEASGKRIFVNVPTAGQVEVIDREKRAVIGKWAVTEAGANFPMALDEGNHRVLIACRRPAKLLVLDGESGKVVANLDCCGDADDVFWDSTHKRVYVSGGEGVISVFERGDGDQYRLAETVKTASGARTSLFVPQTGRLYVAVPHRGEQEAEIRVFQVAAGQGSH